MHHETFWKTAVMATTHCLIGCGIGEVLGMLLGAIYGWSNTVSISVSIILAFIFGYTLTLRPLLKAKLGLPRALRTAFASDTLSITTMEVIDNLIILVIPGALMASLSDSLFWWTLALALAGAFLVTVPVNYWLIRRGKGHALMHEYHH